MNFPLFKFLNFLFLQMSEFGRRRTTVPRRFTGQRSFVQAPVRFQRRRRRRRRRRKTRNPRSGGFLGTELKFYDQKLLATALTSPTDGSGGEHDPSATVLLNTVTQGDGESQRDGRAMVMKSIFVTGVITAAVNIDETINKQQCNVVVYLVLDTQTNGATISSEQVFVNPGANALLATSPLRNLQFTQRFRILDKVHIVLPPQPSQYDGTNLEMGGIMFPFKLSANLNNMKVLFSNTTETVANITDNSLHIIAFANDLDVVPKIAYNSRLRFVG